MTMTDLISRSAVLEIIFKVIVDDSYPKEIDQISRGIEDLPSLGFAQMAHAKFGFVGPDLSGYRYDTRYGTCSNCKRRIVFVPSQTNFCPNCGAKMDAKEDE